MAIRRILADPGLLARLEVEGVVVRAVTRPLDPVDAGEVLVVSGDAEVLAEAAEIGAHRLVAGEPGPTAEAVRELCRELERTPPRG